MDYYSNHFKQYSKETEIRFLKNGHSKSVTCVEVSSDFSFLYSGSKDGLVIKCKYLFVGFVC